METSEGDGKPQQRGRQPQCWNDGADSDGDDNDGDDNDNDGDVRPKMGAGLV